MKKRMKKSEWTVELDDESSIELSRMSSTVYGNLFRGYDDSEPLDAGRWQMNYQASLKSIDASYQAKSNGAALRVVDGASTAPSSNAKLRNPRRVADNEAMVKTRMLRTSPQKLNLVAAMIRGKKVDKALMDLTFSKKRVAEDVKKCLQSAIANAENNHNLDVDELIVAEAYVGKNLTMKRGRPRARGRFGKIIKPFSELVIRVRQEDEEQSA